MKRLRTLVVMHTTLVPPDTLDGPQRKRNRGMAYRVRRGLDAQEVRPRSPLPRHLRQSRRAAQASSPSGSRRSSSTCSRSSTASSRTTSTWSRSSSCCASPTPAAIRAACCCRATSRCASSCCRYPPHPVAAVRRVPARHQAAPAAQDQVPAVREVDHRGCLARHLAGVDRHRQGAAQAAHRVRPRPGADRRAGRGIHRGTRAVRRRDGQRSPHAPAGVGDGLRFRRGIRRGHRDAPREVGQEVPEETRHRHVRGEGSARRPSSPGSTSSRGASIAASGSPVARASTTA